MPLDPRYYAAYRGRRLGLDDPDDQTAGVRMIMGGADPRDTDAFQSNPPIPDTDGPAPDDSAGWGPVRLNGGELIDAASRMPPVPPGQRSPYPIPGQRPRMVGVTPEHPYVRPTPPPGYEEAPRESPAGLIDNVSEVETSKVFYKQMSLLNHKNELLQQGFRWHWSRRPVLNSQGRWVYINFQTFNDQFHTSFAHITAIGGEQALDNIMFRENYTQYDTDGRGWRALRQHPLNIVEP